MYVPLVKECHFWTQWTFYVSNSNTSSFYCLFLHYSLSEIANSLIFCIFLVFGAVDSASVTRQIIHHYWDYIIPSIYRIVSAYSDPIILRHRCFVSIRLMSLIRMQFIFYVAGSIWQQCQTKRWRKKSYIRIINHFRVKRFWKWNIVEWIDKEIKWKSSNKWMIKSHYSMQNEKINKMP